MATNKNNAPVEEQKKDTAPVEEQKDLAAENEALKAELEALRAQKEAETAEDSTGPKMVKVRIPRTKVDQEDVFVSVNLRTYMIKRGVDVEVPDFVYEVLRHQEEMLEEIMVFEAANQR